MTSYQAYEIGPQTGLASLRQVQRAVPEPGPGQALLRVRSVCLNHRDLRVLSGSYGPRRPEQRVPGSDGVGEVVALGPGVQEVAALEEGDRVICPHFVSWPDGAFHPSVFQADLGVSQDGWLAEYLLVPAAALVKVPAVLSDAQAAPLCAAGLTAWHALVGFARLRPGELVLALGTGGVSILALQIARMQGARVAITSSSDEKLAQARALGAEITVNYKRHPDWAAELLRQSGGRGADVIVETGGQGTLAASLRAAAPNGRIALIGALAGGQEAAPPNLTTLVTHNLRLAGITSGSRHMLVALVEAAAANQLQPVIDRSFAFAQAAQAYAWLAAGAHLGKVAIRLID